MKEKFEGGVPPEEHENEGREKEKPINLGVLRERARIILSDIDNALSNLPSEIDGEELEDEDLKYSSKVIGSGKGRRSVNLEETFVWNLQNFKKRLEYDLEITKDLSDSEKPIEKNGPGVLDYISDTASLHDSIVSTNLFLRAMRDGNLYIHTSWRPASLKWDGKEWKKMQFKWIKSGKSAHGGTYQNVEVDEEGEK